MGSKTTSRLAGFAPVTSSDHWGGRATRAEIHLGAIDSNTRVLQRHIAPAQLMAVVKANGYGHGADMVAKAALAHGASRLGVYAVEEGVALRNAGIEAPILVFGPFQPGEAGAFWSHRLTPTITSIQAAEALQRAADGGEMAFHLKLDTGLTRAGVGCEEAVPLMERLAAFSALKPEGLYTHFASADEASKEPTWKQLRDFLHTARCLEDAGYAFPIRHAANSAAILDCPPTHLQMARAGIALYGYYPSSLVAHDLRLRPALSLVSAISRIAHVPAGTGVGYGHEHRCARDSTIALVPIGYGDGLPRTLGNGVGRIIVGNGFAPIVGRVSMDQITVDVTDIPGAAVGDRATLIGMNGELEQTADDLADQAGTISYDVLTGLLPRVPRIYTRGGGVVGVTQLTGQWRR